jgi:hypothetical protein
MKMKFKLNSKIEKILSNKMLLNIVLIVSFLNIIGFVMFGQTLAIIYFILIGLLTSFFSKNMNIVLLVPLILVNLFVAGSSSRMWYKREGLENNSDNSTNNNSTNNNSTNNNSSNNNSTNNNSSNNNSSSNNKKINVSSTSTNQGVPITPLDHNNMNSTNATNASDENETEIDESFEVGRSKKNSQGYNIDYASTVEDAYDELNKILGSDGIKRLTNDTQNLMKQQLQLAESMKSMQPLISGMAPLMQQAQGLLGSMGDNGNLGNLANLAKKFSAGLGNTKQ